MLDKLYSNIGGKIKNWAKWIFICEAIGAIVTGLVFLIDWGFEGGWWGLLISIFGPFVAWVFSWVLYAFGQLIDDVHAIRSQNAEIRKNIPDVTASAKTKADENVARDTNAETKRATIPTSIHKWCCDGCGKMRTQSPCEHCGKE